MNVFRMRFTVHSSIVALTLLAGCGESIPAAPDAAEARQTLTRALDAWRAGQAIEDQKAANPPVIVSDVKWERGENLVRYEIDDSSSRASGAQRVFRVTLWFADAERGEKKDVAHYEVGVRPTITVFRSMFQ